MIYVPPVSLSRELERFAEEFARRCPAEWGPVLTEQMQRLDSSGWEAGLPTVGQPAPEFRASDYRSGAEVGLRDLRGRPLVLSFFRGTWCPFCALELRAYQALSERAEAAGVQLLAVTGEAPEPARAALEELAPRFPVLWDEGYRVGRAYGLLFELPDDLAGIAGALGHHPRDVNADAGQHLLVPATFVIDADGLVTHAFAEMDYRRRWEPEAALRAAGLI